MKIFIDRRYAIKKYEMKLFDQRVIDSGWTFDSMQE